MSDKAKEIIIPKKSGIFRIVFLYVGQGDSTLLVLPSGEEYKYMLIDCNQNNLFGGIDLPILLKDLTDTLHYFVNTHPHKDHISGIKRIASTVNVEEIWHSGHIPGGEHKDMFKEFEEVMKYLGEDHIVKLEGTRNEDLQVGDVLYNILSPAEYVSDDIQDEKPEDRYKRIHEQCAVLRFRYGEDEKQFMITGDADLDAWKKHITEYHKDSLPSTILSASHHGSRSFFKKDEKDDPYIDHIEEMSASYLVISAPKQEESEHGHPHNDALKIYGEHFNEDSILHLGKNRECVIVDISKDGSIEVSLDKELVEEYGSGEDKDDSGTRNVGHVTVLTRLDDKPMGDL